MSIKTEQRRAELDDALQIIKPDCDSHFLLLPCRHCGGNNVAYVQYLNPTNEELWRVVCFDCNETMDPGNAFSRHQVQVLWNWRNNRG